jgi:hypothetical protein
MGRGGCGAGSAPLAASGLGKEKRITGEWIRRRGILFSTRSVKVSLGTQRLQISTGRSIYLTLKDLRHISIGWRIQHVLMFNF